MQMDCDKMRFGFRQLKSVMKGRFPLQPNQTQARSQQQDIKCDFFYCVIFQMKKTKTLIYACSDEKQAPVCSPGELAVSGSNLLPCSRALLLSHCPFSPKWKHLPLDVILIWYFGKYSLRLNVRMTECLYVYASIQVMNIISVHATWNMHDYCWQMPENNASECRVSLLCF